MAVGAKNSTQFDKIGAINGVPEAKIGSLGPVSFSVPAMEGLEISESGMDFYSGSVYSNWDSLGNACDITKIDVSSSSSWNIMYSFDCPWTISPTSGSAGVTPVDISSGGVSGEESGYVQFRIGLTDYATLHLSATSGCV